MDERVISLTKAGQRPADDEMDMFGITHRGKKREENQDHFLLAQVFQQVVVLGTSLPDQEHLPLRGSRLGTIWMVADGVGDGDGGTAARLATESVARYVASSLKSYQSIGRAKEDEFMDSLRDAALVAHEEVRAASDGRKMATTMTLGIGVWPWMYVVQVGDSRAYVYVKGQLHQVTHDQTFAQILVDEGKMRPSEAMRSPLNHMLASAIGSDETTPVVTRVDVSDRGTIVLFCSDGLTKHVSDAEIAKACSTMTHAEQLARELVDLALERGGSDNITIIAGRAPLKTKTP